MQVSLVAITFNAYQITLFGTKVLPYETREKQEIFDFHDAHGFYVGPSIKHYPYHKYYTPTIGKYVQ